MMNIISATKPQWADAAHTAISLTVDFEGLGPIPFGASPNDVEPHGRSVFARAVAGDFGPIAAYVAPAPVITTVVSRRQAREALIRSGLFAQVNSSIYAMTGMEGDLAKNWWENAQTFDRNHPMLLSLATALGLTSEQLDTLFTQAAAL